MTQQASRAALTQMLVGAAIIAVVSNGLTILGVPSFLQDVLTGAIIIAAVLIRQIGRGSPR